MKPKNLYMALAAIGAVTTIALGAAYNVRADQAQVQNDDRGLLRASIEQNNYESFVKGIDKRIEQLSYLKSRENFDKIRQAHELRQNGQHQEARQIMEEAGIDFPAMGSRIRNGGKGQRMGLRYILDQEDYEKFKEATKDKPISEIIDSQEKFDKLIEAHNLRQEGNHEEAQRIMDELGLRSQGPGPGNRGNGNGNGNPIEK